MKVSSFTCGGYFCGMCVLFTDNYVHLISDDIGLIGSYSDKEKAFSVLVEELGYENDEREIQPLRQLYDEVSNKEVEK